MARQKRFEHAAQSLSLPTIQIDVDEARVADEAIAALAQQGKIYQRGGTLVRIVENPPPPACITRPDGGLRLTPLPQPRLRELLTLAATLVQDMGEMGLFPCHPPDWLVRAEDARGQWKGISRLEGIVETPVLLTDGTTLQTPGYDPRSGLFYAPSTKFPIIPARPSPADVEQARNLVLEVVVDFPFQSDAHKSSWFAAMLTPSARHSFDGPSPLFAIDANVRGSGKTLLCDAVGMVHTGRRLPRTSAPKDDEEARKKITSIALAAEPLVLLDNVAGVLASAALDAALTGTTWSDRILGKNLMTGPIPLLTIWFATGNNLVFGGDTPRRTLHTRLESNLENPEERGGFRHPNLLAWVQEQRGQLAAAVLTILRGYCAAGRPDMGLKEWGSFEGWSGLVRNAVVWCGLDDPGATRQELVESSDRHAQLLRLLMTGWEQADPQRRGMTVGEALNHSGESHCGALREAFAEMTPQGEPVNLRSIGMKLHHFKQRVCGGKRLIRHDSRRGAIWRIEQVGESVETVIHDRDNSVCGTNGTSGTNSQPRRREEDSHVCAHAYGKGAGNSPASGASPAELDFVDPAGTTDPTTAVEKPRTCCGSLHLEPAKWVRRGEGAYCPACNSFMGYFRSLG